MGMIVLMRWHGADLITPVSPKGIIDVEFAKTKERLHQLLLFLNVDIIRQNLYLDFLFLLAYGWFFVTACTYVRNKTGWVKTCGLFISLSISAALFDVAENFLLLLVLGGRFDPILLYVVYYTAAIKFIMAGAVVLFLLFSWPFALRKAAMK